MQLRVAVAMVTATGRSIDHLCKLLSLTDRSSHGGTVKENAEFAGKGHKARYYREHRLLLERRAGGVNGA